MKLQILLTVAMFVAMTSMGLNNGHGGTKTAKSGGGVGMKPHCVFVSGAGGT